MTPERQLKRIRKNYNRNAERYERCMGHPTALITPRRVRTRGDKWRWPTSDDGWRALVKSHATFGLSRHPLRDARNRVVLRVHEKPR